MIAVDTNVLVHAHRRDGVLHDRCAAAVRFLAEQDGPWSIPWPCVHEFLAIVTHPRIYDPPTSIPQAVDQVAAWLESPSLVLLAEAPDHWAHLQQVLEEGRTSGSKVHDARIVALCAAHDVRTLWTFDRDFSRWTDRLTIQAPPHQPGRPALAGGGQPSSRTSTSRAR